MWNTIVAKNTHVIDWGNIEVHRNLSKNFEGSKYKTMLGCMPSALARQIEGKSKLTTVFH